ncbi:MAG: ATP-binding cassette domain-containing protein [Gammaproteobacteria bacterium]|nr:MAG: ATP-binding cassette domain-containing protein [Gammaproteobacteria bacterium]
MKPRTLIRADGLVRHYGPHLAVDRVSFTLERGDILGFLGPNGAGKSTTMRMLTGTLAPHAGRIEIDGIDLLERPLEARARIGYLPEQPPLYRELTVDEYLTYCARLHRIPRPRVREAVAVARERCGLADAGGRLIGNLSKGYQQRVGIAQAILHMPAVIVLDEPTVGLDPIQIREIRELIRELGREHGVILSTHILPEVQEVCNRVQIIHRGRLVFSDRLDGIEDRFAEPVLTVRFRQSPGAEALARIPGVREVHALEDGRWRLVHDGRPEVAEAVAATAVAEGWGLQALVPERRTLEQVFVELTTGEAQPREEAA